MRHLRHVTVAFIAIALGMPGVAEAEFLPGAEILSVSPERHEQGDANTELVDISQDGRFVAFQTRARNLFPANHQDPPGEFRRGGIFRRNLETGSLELVALGELFTSGGSLVRNGARNPSISGDGRYVAFASADQLGSADVNTRVDVYVRDMEQPIDSPLAFELVSARDGSDVPATFGGPPAAVTGADVTAEAGLSADGRKVVFATRAASDLPAADLVTTPAGQVFVRDLDANTTTLVTRNKLDGAPAGGASTSSAFAVISADGSTVAWTGTNAGLQTRLQPGEFDLSYYLWRRIADGPNAPTRRITGAADVDDPDCGESQEWINDHTLTGPCYGPLGNPEDLPQGALSGVVPSLSADGETVAFLVNAQPRGFPLGSQLDVYVAEMSPGLSRKAANVELTRELSTGVTGSVRPVTISADGDRIAFVSNRRDFGLPIPRLTTPPPTNEAKDELYVIYMDRMEIERVTRAWNGDEIDGTVRNEFGAIAFSGDARRLAFVSAASNLFPGDANSAMDAFIAYEAGTSDGESRAYEPPFADVTVREDAGQSTRPALPVSLRHGPGSSVRVTVKAPQAGTLALIARARVRAGRRARLRPVAKARRRVRRAGQVTITLKPERRYRRYVRRTRRLRSRLEIRFSPAGAGPALVARRTVSFTP